MTAKYVVNKQQPILSKGKDNNFLENVDFVSDRNLGEISLRHVRWFEEDMHSQANQG